MTRKELNTLISKFSAISEKRAITPRTLGTLLQNISDTIAAEAEACKVTSILDLGVVDSEYAAYDAAAAAEVVQNPEIRMILWRTGVDDGALSGTIFQERCNESVVQWRMEVDGHFHIREFDGTACGDWYILLMISEISYNNGTLNIYECGNNTPRKVLLPTASSSNSGLMSVAQNNKLSALPYAADLRTSFNNLVALIPTAQTEVNGTDNNYIHSVNDKNSQIAVLTAAYTNIISLGGVLQFRKGLYNPAGGGGVYYTSPIPTATSSLSALMHKDDKAKLDALPTAADLTTSLNGKVDKVSGKGLSTHDFNSQWLTRLSNAGVYSRSSANINKSFNASSNVFSLSKTSTQSDITTALTDYESGKVLTAEDFAYCAANGCMIYNGATQGFVQVTANGGGFYNLIEISFTNYTMLPKMRFICLRALDDGTWQVMRNGQEERICYYSELQALTARVAALESK